MTPQTSKRGVQRAHGHIERIRAELGEFELLCSGTLSQRLMRCGKPNCRCASDPDARHGPYYEWARMRACKPTRRYVTAKQAQILRQAIDNAWTHWTLAPEWAARAQAWCRDIKIVVTGGFGPKKIRRFEEQVGVLIDAGTDDGLKARLAELIAEQPAVTTFGDTGLDETLSEMRTQMRRFAEAEVLPHAHEWHLKNEYIPLETIAKMNELGVFGLTIPEEFGGSGAGFFHSVLAVEALSRVDPSIGVLVALMLFSTLAAPVAFASGPGSQPPLLVGNPDLLCTPGMKPTGWNDDLQPPPTIRVLRSKGPNAGHVETT
jgi:hypothetical protein